ncbi:putative acetyltransferase [Bacillus sp. 3255]|nr:putative acetyltransferase [Bacillus sp. 3255]
MSHYSHEKSLGWTVVDFIIDSLQRLFKLLHLIDNFPAIRFYKSSSCCYCRDFTILQRDKLLHLLNRHPNRSVYK